MVSGEQYIGCRQRHCLQLVASHAEHSAAALQQHCLQLVASYAEHRALQQVGMDPVPPGHHLHLHPGRHHHQPQAVSLCCYQGGGVKTTYSSIMVSPPELGFLCFQRSSLTGGFKGSFLTLRLQVFSSLQVCVLRMWPSLLP